MRDIHRKFRAALRTHTLAKLIVQAISWLGTIYALRLLDAQAVGAFAIAAGAFGYATMIYEGGMLEALVQRAPRTRPEKRAVFTLLVGVGTLSALLLVVVARPLAALVETPDVAPLLGALAVSVVATAAGILPHAQLIREMKFGPLAGISSVQAVVSTATLVSLAWWGAGAWSLVWAQVAGAVVRAMMLNFVIPSLHLPCRAIATGLAHLRTSAVLIVDGLLFRWYTSIDVFLLGRWAGAIPLGYFSFGQQVANMPLEKISTVVNDVSLPAYTSLSAERGAAADFMLETMRAHAALGLPIFWGLASVAATAVPLIFGDPWLPAVMPLVALAMVAPLRLIGSVETPAMTGIGRPGVLVSTKLILVPVMTLGLLAGAWWGGVRGVTLAWLLLFPVTYAFAFRLVLRAIGLEFRRVVAALRGPFLAAGAMSLIVAGLQYAAGGTGIPRAVLLCALVLAGAAVYPLALRLADKVAFDLLWERARLLVAES
jgi:teichuronic acid exporter